MSQQWYVARDKKKVGPCSTEQLKALAAQGQLAPTDMLLKEGEAKWVAASTVDGLFVAQVVPPPLLPAASVGGAEGSTPFVVPDIGQLATSGSLHPALIGVGAVLAPPLGLYCVWQQPRWTVQKKWAWTGAAAAVLLVGLFLIPRTILALSLLSGCALWFDVVWTDTTLTWEQKRMPLSLCGMACIIGLTLILLAGHSGDAASASSARAKVRAFERFVDKFLDPPEALADSDTRNQYMQELDSL